MQLKNRWLTLLGLVSLLLVSTAGVAGAAGIPPVIQPKIVAASSNGPPCPATVCPLIVTLTYNTAVGVTNNAAPDFKIEDIANEQMCSVVSVTSSPPPSPVVPPVPVNTLYLKANCLVRPGDVMVLVYRESPSTTAGYVFNANDPSVHALSPQPFAWFNGPQPAA